MRRLSIVVFAAVFAAGCTIQQQGSRQAPGERRVGGTAVPGAGGTPVPPSLAPDAKLAWRAGAPMPTPRTEVTATVLAGLVFVAGGFLADGSVSDAVEALHPGRNEWSKVTPLPKPLHHTAIAATGGRLYVIGGYTADGKASKEVFSMPPGGTQWVPVASLPSARGALAAAVVEGRIHAVGGASSFRPGVQPKLSGEHVFYDVTDGVWKRAASLPEPRDHLGAAGVGQRLVVAGGRKLSLETNSARVDVYDIDAQRWRRGKDMPTARGGLAGAAWEGRGFFVGGEQPSGTFAQVEYYDPGTDNWFSGPSLPTPRHGLGVAGFEFGELVVIGGGPKPGLTVSGATEILSKVE